MALSDNEGFIWYDGKMVPWREANTHVLTHTLHYGVGIFEGVRVYETATGPAIFRLNDHTERFFRSAHILGMPLPIDKATLLDAQQAVVRQNQLQAAYIRPMAFYGAEELRIAATGLSVHVIVAAWRWENFLNTSSPKEQGIRVKTSSFSRHHVNVHMCKAKASANYLNAILAHNEVEHDGYDEALLLDVDGYVAEGAGENIFIARNGKLYTPDPTSALEGITRDTVIHLAADLGIPVVEKRITRDEVYCADEAFFTGTAAEIIPIRELDNRQIGAGVRGPLTTKIQQMYFNCVHGRDAKHSAWLTPTTV